MKALAAIVTGMALTVCSARAERTYVRGHSVEITNDTSIRINAILVQPDGKTIIGGQFTSINGYERRNVARFNTDGTLDQSWKVDIWDGNRSVAALAVNDSAVFIGGNFSTCQGAVRPYLAKVNITNGALDAAFTSTPNSYVCALVATGTDLYVGGIFTNIGGVGRRGLARLNASSGIVDPAFTNAFTNTTGYGNATIYALLLHNTNLYVGGNFVSAGAYYRCNLAMIRTGDGQVDMTFSNNVGGAGNDSVYCLATDGSNFYAGGDFLVWGGPSRNNVAKFNPTNATADAAFTNGCGNYVYSLAVDDTGLYVGGTFTNTGSIARAHMAKLNKTNGNADVVFTNGCSNTLKALAVHGTNLLAGGYAGLIGGARTYGFARADRATGAIQSGGNPRVAEIGAVYTIIEQPDGKPVIGGNFNTVDGAPRRNIARFNRDGTLDATWQPDADGDVCALATDDNFVYVGGEFNSIGGGGAYLEKINQADGTADTTFDPNPNSYVYALLMDGTDLYTGGQFNNIDGQPRNRLARINNVTGQADTIFTNGVSGGAFLVLNLVQHGNNLFIGGGFDQAQGQNRTNAAAFNCADGQLVAGFVPNPNDWARAIVSDGANLYLGGYFDYVAGIVQPNLAKLSPATGQPVAGFTNSPNSTVMTLCHDGRHLYAGGFFTNIGAQAASRLARINQSSGAKDLSFTNQANATVWKIVSCGARLYIGGVFGEVDGVPTVAFAELFIAPPAPTALPATGVLGSTFTAQWEQGWTATNYFLDVGLDAGFSALAQGYNNRSVGNVASTSVTGLHALTTYYYRLRSGNEAGTSTNSATITVATTLDIPGAVAASRGDLTDRVRVTWGTVSEAEQYMIYRNTIDDSASATVIASVAASVTSYDDTNVSAGNVYYYWIRTMKASAISAFSASGSGWLGLLPPGGLSASGSIYTDKVKLTWLAVTGATGYQVWRHTTNDSALATQVGATTDLAYDDTTAILGTLYYYWVKATNALTTSAFSASASGWRASVSSGVCADYDGDGKADPAVYDEATGTWRIKYSGANYYQIVTIFGGLGGPGAASVSADYDGDKKADPAVYYELTGRWAIMLSSANYEVVVVLSQPLGGEGYSGMPVDYDGDAKADPGVYQRERGDWKVLMSSANYFSVEVLGLLGGVGFLPVAADYDGDKKADPAVYFETTGDWKIMLSGAGYWTLNLAGFLGGSGCIPCPADYDGDGLADPAVRSVTGNEWIVMLSTAGYAPMHLTLPFE